MQSILQILDSNSKSTIKIFSYHTKIENMTAKHDDHDQFLLEFITLLDNTLTFFCEICFAKKA